MLKEFVDVIAICGTEWGATTHGEGRHQLNHNFSKAAKHGFWKLLAHKLGNLSSQE